MNDNIQTGFPKAKFYGLDGQLITLEEWAELTISDKKILARDEIGDYLVSTVLLGIDHCFHINPGMKPIIFETMVFKDDDEDYVERYSTKEEALEGHKRAVVMTKALVEANSRRHAKEIV
jgi:hypothetical protein